MLFAAAWQSGGAMAAAQEASGIVNSSASSYTLRPGDILEIDVWGHPEFSGQFQVDETGALQYPVLGRIDSRDMTVAALRQQLQGGLEELFKSPFLTITPLFRIAVMGQVLKPGLYTGLYTVDPTLSVLDIVALAGGQAPAGNLSKIKLLRAGQETRVNFERETLRGLSLQDIRVRSGDQIVVPRKFLSREDVGLILSIVQIGLTVAIFANTIK